MQKMLSLMRKCIDDYRMIEPGDHIAVGISGGKDSLALLTVLAELRRFYPHPFTLTAITIDAGYEEIGKILFEIRNEKNPCALCAKMRRGALNDAALAAGCKKVALGHHFDDAVETFMLSLFYEGRLNCFYPVTFLDRRGITVIRPMLYIPERQVINFARRQELPVVHNLCPADKHTKREEVKALLRELEHTHHDLRERIFGAIQRYPLVGWEKE